MGDGDIELRIVRILLLHETMSSGNVSDGRYIKREQDRAKAGALWHAQVHLVVADLADWMRTN